jgi:hypothetical protein
MFVLGALELGARRVGTLHRSRGQRFEQGASPANVLVTGNSRETVGVICRELGMPCAKLAAGSQSLLMDAQILRQNQNAFPHARFLLIGISYYSFEYALDDEGDWRLFEYYHAYGIDGEREALPRTDIRRYSVAATYSLRTALGWAAAGFPRLLPAAAADAAGDVDVGALVQRERSQTALVRRIGMHERSRRPELVRETTAAVAWMIQWARLHGAEPVLIVSPVTRDYARAADPARVAAMQASMAALASRYNVRVADYMTDPRFREEEFFDFDHLNHDGARHYTALLRAEVLSGGQRQR